MGGRHLNDPVVGVVATSDGGGYWLVAGDGGVFAFGDAPFRGSAGGMGSLGVVGMVSTPSDQGYWLLTAAGSIKSFGDAPAETGLSTRPASPIVGGAPG
jgi:hypothetical protein